MLAAIIYYDNKIYNNQYKLFKTVFSALGNGCATQKHK
jgi:hypothetical protein